ncbi:bacteriocin [Frondihabitans sucicola]|uniref:Type 1 encapsulin shell protein n=1 Tax=Frondihabitans sucicola TaxID=1268041 RepID=A0ABN6Y5Q4_9MICO|nr:family 1 encapsulin nanocompartment shell protein [Frondihabitans sucicola]BDZ51288.1 bacteriocin [Frondihabitans sucicola]
MNHLLRELAPFGSDVWALLDDEATTRLTVALAARRLVDFAGPKGWTHSAVDLGRTDDVAHESIRVKRRRILPLLEARADFRLRREELVDSSRGATDVDLGPLDTAALSLAAFENELVFGGPRDASGLGEVSPHPVGYHDGSPDSFRAAVGGAVAALRSAGVGGPYSLAASPSDWTTIVETDDDGYPLRTQLEGILGGSLEWTPGITGSVVLSTRGGDYELTVGEDLSLGYSDHDIAEVGLYVEETLAFRVNTPEAAVRLLAASSGAVRA